MPLVRPATALDIHAITEIYAHHVLHGAATFETKPPDASEMERRRLEVTSQGLPYLVVELDGRVAGYAYAGLYRTRAAYRFTVEDSIYIHPERIGQGLGRLALSRLIELCEAKGSREMIAVIGDSANAASIRLHERFRFRTLGVLEGVGRKFGRWVDTVIMQRALYRDARLSELRQVAEREQAGAAALNEIAEFLRRSGDYRWVGLYEVDHEAGQVRNLVFRGLGPPAYPAFPIQKGLTGTAIRERRTVNTGDVGADPAYLTAFGTTRSEIIVPIFDAARGKVAGTIDIESERFQAFDDNDQIFLEDCAEVLRSRWDRLADSELRRPLPE